MEIVRITPSPDSRPSTGMTLIRDSRVNTGARFGGESSIFGESPSRLRNFLDSLSTNGLFNALKKAPQIMLDKTKEYSPVASLALGAGARLLVSHLMQTDMTTIDTFVKAVAIGAGATRALVPIAERAFGFETKYPNASKFIRSVSSKVAFAALGFTLEGAAEHGLNQFHNSPSAEPAHPQAATPAHQPEAGATSVTDHTEATQPTTEGHPSESSAQTEPSAQETAADDTTPPAEPGISSQETHTLLTDHTEVPTLPVENHPIVVEDTNPPASEPTNVAAVAPHVPETTDTTTHLVTGGEEHAAIEPATPSHEAAVPTTSEEPISPTTTPNGFHVAGSAEDGSLTIDGNHWDIVGNGMKNVGHLLDKTGSQGIPVDKGALASNLQKATKLWTEGRLDQSSDLWRLFHLSNGTASVYSDLLDDKTLESLKNLNII